MEGEDIIEVEYCMSELVDMALGQRIDPASLDLTTETVNPLEHRHRGRQRSPAQPGPTKNPHRSTVYRVFEAGPGKFSTLTGRLP
jgi:hypothetical protein